MSQSSIDAKLVRSMFYAGAKKLESEKEVINELNVFPVPDGDTGTNMTMTIMSAVKEVAAVSDLDMKSLTKAMSSGSLKGARGNSGVILSQLMRGFCRVAGNYDEVTVSVASEAFAKAVETAYNAVMKPKEGTILTVAKAGAVAAEEISEKTEDLEEFLQYVIEKMEIALEHTPDQLPVLKEAGVVDSGGTGLLEVMYGVRDALLGKAPEEYDFAAPTGNAPKKATGAASEDISTADIKFGYCTEFIIMLEKEFPIEAETAFKAYLSSIGDSIVCVADDEIVKIHVHTNDPGLAIQKALTYGQLTRMKIDNMREEHNERVIQNAEKEAVKQLAEDEKLEAVKDSIELKGFGFIAVSAGEGMTEIFKGLGVDYVISGGQTMNPSTEDMLKAIDLVPAKDIYILPNNSNIILAAQQAKSLVGDKNIYVIPSKTIPQGISAMINFHPEMSGEENEAAMTESLAAVKSGEVTYAVRDTSFEGHEIHEGDIMGINDKGIAAVGRDLNDTTFDLIQGMVDDESTLISLYYGSDLEEEKAQELADRLMDTYDYVDVEVQPGGQPVYYYILSVE